MGRLLRNPEVLSEYVIDKIAIGLDFDVIVSDAKIDGITLSSDDIKAIEKEYSEEIKERKKELIEELKKHRGNIREELRVLVSELKEGLLEAKKKNNLTAYASISNALRTGLESLNKINKSIELEKELNKIQTESEKWMEEKPITPFDFLQKKGIIEIKNREKLEEIFKI